MCAFPWKRVNNNQDPTKGGLGSECGGSVYALVIDSCLGCVLLLLTHLLSIRTVEIVQVRKINIFSAANNNPTNPAPVETNNEFTVRLLHCAAFLFLHWNIHVIFRC